MAPRKRCLVCGSRQWWRNAAGLVTCGEGHVLQHYINESEEVGDVGAHMIKKRTLKSNRKKKERASSADSKLYHGHRARFHYYQCLQLLFRKQVVALIALWNLPPEFETTCRDLWALHLNLIPRPPPAEPFYYTREQQGYQRKPPEESQPGRADEGASSSEGAAPALDGDVSSSEDELLIPEITALLEDNSEVSSSDDGSSSDKPRARSDMYTSSKSPFVSRADRPENTIAVLVLACHVIRLPVVYMDFINAIESHALPYLDQVRFFPSSLACHLTKHAVQALSPRHAPKILSLHRLAVQLANRFYDTFDVVLPKLNAAPVLWRVVQECFCGTPMLYVLTKRVGDVLSLGSFLQGSSARGLSSTGGGDTDSQRHDNAPPEICLAGAAIVALKLVYGLDGKERLSRDSDDIACALPAAAEFLAAVKEADDAESRVQGRRFSSRMALSVGDLDETALDEYLDLCQKVLVGPKGDAHAVVDRHFPLARGTGDLTEDGRRLGLRGRGQRSARQGGESGVPAPGEAYTIYDAQDALGGLPGDLERIVERAARWAGTDRDFMCGVVERYERRLVRWWNGIRQERGGD